MAIIYDQSDDAGIPVDIQTDIFRSDINYFRNLYMWIYPYKNDYFNC